jgi:hypothetical protein
VLENIGLFDTQKIIKRIYDKNREENKNVKKEENGITVKIKDEVLKDEIEEKKDKVLKNDEIKIEEKKDKILKDEIKIEEKQIEDKVPKEDFSVDTKINIIDKMTNINYDMKFMYENYIDFCERNAKEIESLWNTYSINVFGSSYKSDRMYMIHGVTSSKKGADNMYDKLLKDEELKANKILIHRTGFFYKFNPSQSEVNTKETEKNMNLIMHQHIENLDEIEKYKKLRTDIYLQESINNGLKTQNEPSKEVQNMTDTEFDKNLNRILFNKLPNFKIDLCENKKKDLVNDIKDIEEKLGDFKTTPKIISQKDNETINFVDFMIDKKKQQK